MKATAEISLYPLTESYADIVTNYILELKKIDEITVSVTGLSSVIIGEYDTVWNAIADVTKKLFEENKAVLTLKIAAGELTTENLPEVLK